MDDIDHSLGQLDLGLDVWLILKWMVLTMAWVRLILVCMVFLTLLIHPGQVLLVTICCLVDFDADDLDHAHSLGQVVLGQQDVSQTF